MREEIRAEITRASESPAAEFASEVPWIVSRNVPRLRCFHVCAQDLRAVGLTVHVRDAIDACPPARACERRHRTDGGDVRNRQDAARNPTRDRWRRRARREQLLGFAWAMSDARNGGALLA